jgi:hypothetical protein
MKQRTVIFLLSLILIVLSSYSVKASDDDYFYYVKSKYSNAPSHSQYRFPYIKGLEVKVTPEFPEFPTGSIATFTITLTNKNKYPVNIEYSNGRQFDMVILHGASQIFRWSNGFTWKKARHSIPLGPGESRSEKLSWVAVNKFGGTLPQGVYKCVGLATCLPKTLVSNEVKFRLGPPSVVKKEIINTRLNQAFEIELPRYANEFELVWEIVYAYNDNRISATSRKIKPETIVITFLPRRIGHVEFDLYAYPTVYNKTVSLERRSYRIEVE